MTLLSTPIDFLKRFRILVVEFHSFHRVRNDYFLENIGIPVFEKLEKVFDVVHIHPNNIAQNVPFLNFYLPHALEITFHRKDRRKTTPTKISKFENSLDSDTVRGLKKVILDDQLFT